MRKREMTQESFRDASSSLRFHQKDWQSPYQELQYEGLDGTFLQAWPDTPQAAEDALSSYYNTLSTHNGVEPGLDNDPSQVNWGFLCSHSRTNQEKRLAGSERSTTGATSESSSWTRHDLFTLQSGSQTYRASDTLPASTPGTVAHDRQPTDVRLYPGLDKVTSQSWSQASSVLDGGSSDDFFSEMSPRTAYSSNSIYAMQVPATESVPLPQSQAHGNSVLDFWWDNGCDADTTLSPSEVYPDAPLDDTDFPPLGSTWLDEIINENEFAHYGYQSLSFSSPEENHSSASAIMPGGTSLSREKLGGHINQSLAYENFVPAPTEEFSYALTLDKWTSLENLSLSQDHRPSRGVHNLRSVEKSGLNIQMKEELQSPQRGHLPGPSPPGDFREETFLQGEAHKTNSVASRRWSARHKVARVRVHSKARCAQRPDAKDLFLVQSKLAGMSYREIRDRGNFTEAESTLRGRFRTLTKDKDKRVRKPEWEDCDIILLREGVRLATERTRLQSTTQPGRGTGKGTSRDLKIPWKQVAEHIAQNGGSYHFGNATCRKKWDEINKAEEDKADGGDGGGGDQDRKRGRE